MQVKRSTPLISSQPAIIWIMWPCEPLATNPLPHPLYMMSHFLLTRWNSLPKSSLRHTRTFLMCSHKKRLRTCLPITNLTMKFTLRMTRCLPIVTSTCSLAQSSVSCTNSSMTCLARGSSDHPNCQVVHLSALLRRRMAPCNSALTSETSTRSLERIGTQSHSSPTSSTNLAVQRSTPSLTSMLATTIFASQLAMSGRQPSKHNMGPLSSWSCQFVVIYLDDILIFSDSLEDHEV